MPHCSRAEGVFIWEDEPKFASMSSRALHALQGCSIATCRGRRGLRAALLPLCGKEMHLLGSIASEKLKNKTFELQRCRAGLRKQSHFWSMELFFFQCIQMSSFPVQIASSCRAKVDFCFAGGIASAQRMIDDLDAQRTVHTDLRQSADSGLKSIPRRWEVTEVTREIYKRTA